MSWYDIFIGQTGGQFGGIAAGHNVIYSDFQTVLNWVKTARALTGQNPKLFQYNNGTWTEIPVYI